MRKTFSSKPMRSETGKNTYPLVTISIPLYNCENFIEKCLHSVLLQTYSNIEVSLINDQTKDNSVEVAQNFITQHQLQDFWKIIHLEQNSGLSVVRNKGIDTANGKYIFFLDSDDTITADCISSFVEIAEKLAVKMVVGETEAIDMATDKRFDIFPITVAENKLTDSLQIFLNFIQGNIPVASWNKLIDLKFLKDNHLYFVPNLYAQDSLHSYQMMKKLDSIAFLRKKTYHYYLHENSVIHNRHKKHFDNWFTIASFFDKSWKEEKNNLRKRLILKHIIDYKDMTLLMNWKAQQNEDLWKESYTNYKKLKSLSIRDYLSPNFSNDTKKKSLFVSLPTALGLWVFKKRYYR